MSDEDLRSALAEVLQRPVDGVVRTPFPYSSSHLIEQLEVVDGGGEQLSVLFKDLTSSPRAGKPAFATDPLREITIYEQVLRPEGIDAPACFGAHVDSSRERVWLFLEVLRGRPLWQIGDPEAWKSAARWLGGLHGHQVPPRTRRLLRYDAEWFGRWLERARARTPTGSLDALEGYYPRVIERLTGWPTSFVHGEFYASNVLLQSENGAFRVRPLDWEMAGVGPGLLDLAALTSGGWTEEERHDYALAYFEASPASVQRRGEADFFDVLAHCRLHVAVQWLGWSEAWKPPGAQGHDWLADVVRLTEELEL